MNIVRAAISAGLLAALALTQTAASAAGASCETLSALALPNTRITSAQAVPAGDFSQPAASEAPGQLLRNLPAFCRVAATLTPSSDSDIKIEVWMPASNWNGKYQAVGNGGWAGAISYPAMAEALRRGYATSSTDTGHTGANGKIRAGASREAD